MPHSGGGGSHSSGSHHSSHHSSSHSSGGSHSSGRGTVKVSSQPFAGSHTFVVYDKSGASSLVYSSSSGYKAEGDTLSLVSTIIFCLLFIIPGALAVIAGIFLMFSQALSFGMTKTKLPSSIDDAVYIYDRYDYLSEDSENELKGILEDFRDETGIITSIEIIDDELWQKNYADLEAFAYDSYVTKYDDEYHLLIVYSYGYADESTGFNEFNWESMWEKL